MDVVGILPDTATHRNRRLIRSQTSNREYTVSQRISTGAWECSCLGWTTHRKCKHIPREQACEHWMCIRCRNDEGRVRTLAIPPLRNAQLGVCCWCGKHKTTLSAPAGMKPPCEDIHLSDMS